MVASSIKALLILLLASLFFCCSKSSPTAVTTQVKVGAISVRISSGFYPFKNLAKSATIKIYASDFSEINAGLNLTDSTVSGQIENIPAGKARIIDIAILDSTKTEVYKGTAIVDIKSDTLNKVTITLNRVIGSLNVTGNIVEAPVSGWSIYDGFETGALSANWKPYPGTIGSIITDRVHSGKYALKVTYSDYRYTFEKPLSSGKISWWYYDNSGTPWSYFFILTDTSKSDLTLDNVHVVTNIPATYSFYHTSLGYKNDISRTAGWKNFVATVSNSKISIAVDGQVGITISEVKPIIGFDLAGAIIDDFSVLSN